MGGFGSGRHGSKRKAEHLRALDVNRLHRDGCLDDDSYSVRAWRCDDGDIVTIGLLCDGASLTLRYRIQLSGADWKDIEERVPLERMPCRYGGSRPWFRCPGNVNGRPCYRRAGKLFLAGRYFLCRHCQRVAYTSQSETPLDRLHRRRDKVRAAMGAQRGFNGYIPPRPKGMWYRSYFRKLDAISVADAAAVQAFGVAASKLLRRLQRR